MWACLFAGLKIQYSKRKTQISCAVTTQLISAFVFATRIVQFLFYLNPKFQVLVIFSDCTGRLVSYPEDRFSRVAVQIMLIVSEMIMK